MSLGIGQSAWNVTTAAAHADVHASCGVVSLTSSNYGVTDTDVHDSRNSLLLTQPLVNSLARIGPYALADLVSFADVRTLGSLSAVCTVFRACMFDDIDFWTAYTGHSIDIPERSESLVLMRSVARRSAFGLEGAWGRSFADSSTIHRPIDTFSRALCILRGIGPDDDEFETARFIGALVQLVGTFDARCSRTRNAAEAVVQKAKEREQFIPHAAMVIPRAATPVRRLRAFLQSSIERAEEKMTEIPEILDTALSVLRVHDEETRHQRDGAHEDVAPEQCTTKVGVSHVFRAPLCILREICFARSGVAFGAIGACAVLTPYLSDWLQMSSGVSEFLVLVSVMPVGFAVGWKQNRRAKKSE